ncbi:hypothetical protein AAC387_Pa06g3182 [Persea americana]
MINAGVQLKESPIEWPTDAERISLMGNDIKVLSGQPNCRSLLTLLLQRNPVEKIIPHSYFNHMCSLRVLDLSRTGINALPESISNLKNLRALLLGSCEFLEEVPSLSNLEELRVLDISGTAIRELPPGMEAMVKLQLLNLDWTKELRVFPIGIIPHLSFLEELTMHGSIWKWSSMTTEGARIEDIVNSTRLANLEIDFTDLSSFLYHVKSGNWQMKKNFRLCVGSSSSGRRRGGASASFASPIPHLFHSTSWTTTADDDDGLKLVPGYTSDNVLKGSEEWSALEGVSRLNNRLTLARFIPEGGQKSF